MTNCIQCGAIAKWQERKNPKNTYCSKSCQFIGLNGDDNIVGLISSDNIEFKITLEMALKMKTLANIIEDLKNLDDWIPLPGIDSRTLKQVITGEYYDFFNVLYAVNYLDYADMINRMILMDPNAYKKFTKRKNIIRFKPLIYKVFYSIRNFLDAVNFKNFVDYIDPTILSRFENFTAGGIKEAALDGDLEVVKVLIERGEKPENLLHFAHRYPEMIEYLLSLRIFDPYLYNNELLYISSRDGIEKNIDLVFNYDPTRTFNESIRDFIDTAIRNGHLNVVVKLMKKGKVEPNRQFLREAIASAQVEVVKYFANLKTDAEIELATKYLQRSDKSEQRQEIFKILLE